VSSRIARVFRSTGRLVKAHADDQDPVERGVQLPVASSVEPVPGRSCRTRPGLADSGELGERGLRADPLGIVADHDQDFGGGVRTDPERFHQFGEHAGG
jgi:hypothetical protein